MTYRSLQIGEPLLTEKTPKIIKAAEANNFTDKKEEKLNDDYESKMIVVT